MKEVIAKKVVGGLVLVFFLAVGLVNPALAADDYWEAYNFEAGQFFTFLVEQTEPAEMGFEFTMGITAPEAGQLLAEIEGVLDMGQMEMPLYIAAQGPDDEYFAQVLFDELVEDFVGWLLLSFFSPSLFLLDLPALTMIEDDTGEWMDIPVEVQRVPLESGATLERSFELVDEDGELLEVMEVMFTMEAEAIESFDLHGEEDVLFNGYRIDSELDSGIQDTGSINVSIFIVPEFPLPVKISLDQTTDDPEFGTFSTRASMRITSYTLP